MYVSVKYVIYREMHVYNGSKNEPTWEALHISETTSDIWNIQSIDAYKRDGVGGGRRERKKEKSTAEHMQM